MGFCAQGCQKPSYLLRSNPYQHGRLRKSHQLSSWKTARPERRPLRAQANLGNKERPHLLQLDGQLQQDQIHVGSSLEVPR